MINLVPPSLKEERRYGRKNVSLVGYSVALTLTALATAGIMIAGIQFIATDEPALKKRLDESALEIAALENDIKPIEQVATRLDTAKLLDEKSISFSELIPKIAAVLPDGVVLNALALTGGSTTDPLQLDVDLRTAELGPTTIRNLIDSDLFEAADISTLTPKGTSEDDTSQTEYQFNASITANFTGTADAIKKQKAKEAAANAAAATEQAQQQGGAQ
ncbi:MAG TPA: hypothetical protein PKD20_01375 [Candidatus Saccharibacteria bacterium]|jgi:Tfp pilus assembly protein PilN|nr:hypothetical protein [Candidatus Saccharibacteria bacterium]HMT55508.1 hypothetical protein [Candidatus Saccharibacteria bacterium]